MNLTEYDFNYSPELKSAIDLNVTSNQTNNLEFHSSIGVELLTWTVLLIGVLGNSIGLLVFFLLTPRKKVLPLDRILRLVFSIGLLSTLISTPMHLYVFSTRKYPFYELSCQIQGLVLNLVCLLSIWYSTVLSFERFMKVVSPHEHRQSFSALNLNIIMYGLIILMVVQASGPIYGWAQYNFNYATASCLLDLGANHIFIYVIIHTTGYVFFPSALTLITTAYIVKEACLNNTKLKNGSELLNTMKDVIYLSATALFSIILLQPYHMTLLRQSFGITVSTGEKVIGYWLHLFGMTCIYPLFILALIFAKAMKLWKKNSSENCKPRNNCTPGSSKERSPNTSCHDDIVKAYDEKNYSLVAEIRL